ncbi:hypothetical protein [Sphingomonas sp. BAUL-RG-20F-R05-02]|uniref:hypothetical protein n=1 Tax=Sphingomonas sp. BAUL-RG-20F-R05-02 TaxID=2914830 RepID=UPI001F5694A4|nr:hypothetical protein [Sphingomonas sp. BAUL-RG-20F-R05-02]
MDMPTYLAEVQHAASSLIALIWAEHDAVEHATDQLDKLTAAANRDYDRVDFMVRNDLDDDGIGTFLHWETYFGVDKERYHAAEDVSGLEEVRDARRQSRAAMSGALLQIAKQGLSQIHGKPATIPPGRTVMSVDLKTIIWEGRNQSLHWEEGNPRPAIVTCFGSLAAADSVFGGYATTNLAFETIKALEWRNWETYEADLLSIG